jgi:hypothetical protein
MTTYDTQKQNEDLRSTEIPTQATTSQHSKEPDTHADTPPKQLAEDNNDDLFDNVPI